MEEIAIISDIHGNLEALKETLKDIEERNITRIFCLGDIIGKGTHSEECLNLIKNKCEIIIKGIYNSKNINDKISFELVSLPYNIELELENNNKNIEKEEYEKELRTGIYRNIEKFKEEIDKISNN